MSRQEVVTMLREHLGDLRQRFGVVHLSLFGSVARNEAGADSDLDILVDFGRAPNFDQYMGVKFYLEDLFNTKVDLVTVGGLRKEVRPHIEQDLIEISDAA